MKRLVLEVNGVGKNMANLPRDENGDLIVRIGHSPDPDDAFMFHAMTTNAFPTPGYNFVHELQDIETLNHRAMNCELEVSAVSIHAYPDIAENYALMNCGASMGEGYGPMIVSKKGLSVEDAKSSIIAVPGLKTSAYLGLRLAWGDVNVEVVPFDEIIPRILDDTYQCGLIIHEGQLTYVEHDLNVLIDVIIEKACNKDGEKMFNATHILSFKTKADTNIIVDVASKIMGTQNVDVNDNKKN